MWRVHVIPPDFLVFRFFREFEEDEELIENHIFYGDGLKFFCVLKFSSISWIVFSFSPSRSLVDPIYHFWHDANFRGFRFMFWLLTWTCTKRIKAKESADRWSLMAQFSAKYSERFRVIAEHFNPFFCLVWSCRRENWYVLVSVILRLPSGVYKTPKQTIKLNLMKIELNYHEKDEQWSRQIFSTYKFLAI